jgi:hypothetical protein
MRPSRNPNRVLVLLLGFIICAVVIVSFLATTRSAVVLARTTPAGAVQVYLKAIFTGRNAEAAKIFSPESACTVTDLDRAYIANTARVLLLDSMTAGSTAEVRIREEIPAGGPLGDSMTEDHTFRLAKSSSSWLLIGIPWPLYDCGVLKK